MNMLNKSSPKKLPWGTSTPPTTCTIFSGFLNPLTPKVSFVILLTVYQTILILLVWRICHLSTWYCIDIVRRDSVFVTHRNLRFNSSPVSISTPGWREFIVRVKFLAKEHNTITQQRAPVSSTRATAFFLFYDCFLEYISIASKHFAGHNNN